MNADLANKRMRRAEPRHWNDEIEQATGRAFNWRCPFCDVDLRQTGYHKAHVNPIGSGIGLVPGNVVLACPECNMDMHQRHAQAYCIQKGISFWPIQYTLEILRRIFQPGDLGVKKGLRVIGAGEKTKQHLDANPEDLNLSPRELAKKIGVWKSTANNVQRWLREQKGYVNGHGDIEQ